MESFRIWGIPTIITNLLLLLLLCVFTVDPVKCQTQTSPVLLNPIYALQKASSTKLKLKLSETRYDATTRLACARMCRIRRSWNPACATFIFHTGNKACDLYVPGHSVINDPNLLIYILRRRDKFITYSVGQNLYSINFATKKGDYDQARWYCNSQGQGGKLLEFDTLEKYDVVRTLIPETDQTQANAWIGANDRAVEGQWITQEDGLPLNNVTWRWRSDRKFGGINQNCARLHMSTLTISDTKCGSRMQIMCERDVVL